MDSDDFENNSFKYNSKKAKSKLDFSSLENVERGKSPKKKKLKDKTKGVDFVFTDPNKSAAELEIPMKKKRKKSSQDINTDAVLQNLSFVKHLSPELITSYDKHHKSPNKHHLFQETASELPSDDFLSPKKKKKKSNKEKKTCNPSLNVPLMESKTVVPKKCKKKKKDLESNTNQDIGIEQTMNILPSEDKLKRLKSSEVCSSNFMTDVMNYFDAQDHMHIDKKLKSAKSSKSPGNVTNQELEIIHKKQKRAKKHKDVKIQIPETSDALDKKISSMSSSSESNSVINKQKNETDNVGKKSNKHEGKHKKISKTFESEEAPVLSLETSEPSKKNGKDVVKIKAKKKKAKLAKQKNKLKTSEQDHKDSPNTVETSEIQLPEVSVSTPKKSKSIANASFIEELDFREWPVDFDIPILHKDEDAVKLTAEKKSNYIERGAVIREGCWSLNEKEMILRNYTDFVMHLNVQNPSILLESKQKMIQLFLKVKHFYVRLAENLKDRTLFSVLTQLRSILNSNKLTDDEMQKLNKYHSEFKDNWAAVGHAINRPAYYCKETFRLYGNGSVDENAKLLNAIEKIFGVNFQHESYKQYRSQWKLVSDIIKTKTAKECHKQWLKVVNPTSQHKQIDNKSKSKWNNIAKAKLILILHRKLPEDSESVDWESVYLKLKQHVSSAASLEKKWKKMKKKLCPSFKGSLNELILYMYQKHLLKLM